MDLSFWKERWETGQTGFHEGRPNELLVRHAPLLDGRRRVLVPLAGKATDMLFLATRGHDVVGVEAIEQACRGFFDDNGLPLVESGPSEERGPFRAFAGGGVELLCGDFFEATPARLGTFDAAWDRAALIALDPTTRRRYVDTVHALLAPGGRILLVTFAYDQTKLPGPPWSVDDATVQALFLADSAGGPRFTVEKLEERRADGGPKFKAAGADELTESIYLVTRR